MNGADFYDKVQAHPDLELVGAAGADKINPVLDVLEKECVLFVRCSPCDEFYQLTAAGIAGVEWEALEKVLTGEREPLVLDQMTRICGYYSNVGSWNLSKIGELADRRKGDYKIP